MRMISLISTGMLFISAIMAVGAEEAQYPYPGNPDADIWVLAGQSNMHGAGLITKKYKPNPKVKIFNMDNKWIKSVPPTHRIYDTVTDAHKLMIFKMNPALTEQDWNNAVEYNKKVPQGGVGPDTSFANYIAKHTGNDVGLIPCALGATAMLHWDPADLKLGDKSLYGNMIARIKMVGGNLKGILWYQGESETDSNLQKTFNETFLNLVDSIRKDTGHPDLPFIYVQIARVAMEDDSNAVNWEIIREKQRTVAYKRKNLFVVPAIDLPNDDLIHIGEEGQRRLGERMAKIALDKVYKTDGGAATVDYSSYEILPAASPLHNKMRVKFTGVNGKLQSPGRATGFTLRSNDEKKDGPSVFKVEFDKDDPSSVIIWYSKEITEPISLYYGAGINPYVNITDSEDMSLPAFGPIVIKPKK
jgi:sialate O-acetylesterase